MSAYVRAASEDSDVDSSSHPLTTATDKDSGSGGGNEKHDSLPVATIAE